MGIANWDNRTLFHGDNLDFLRAMNSESVDLIATDPPFNKGRDFHATPDSLTAGAKFQDRWSWEQDVHRSWIDQIEDDHPNIMRAIRSARELHSDGMGAFLCFMSVRLLAMQRVLKPTGSIYLHCDQTANSYIRMVMDAVFSVKNFRNEIVWSYNKWSNSPSSFQKNHDNILFYTKRDSYYYQTQYDDPTTRQIDLRNAGYNLGTNSKGKIVRIYDSQNPIVIGKLKSGAWSDRDIYYVDGELRGKPMSAVWNISALNGQAKERAGYPTQKPVALYERIIKASCPEDGIVLDPFAGCATTCVAAERLGRQWVGIDLWNNASAVVAQRMKSECADIFGGTITTSNTPPQRTDDALTASPYLRAKVSVHEPKGDRMSRLEIYDHLIEQHGSVCQGCDRKFDDPRYLELDHNTPRADGGINHISNRILLCGPCNRLKSNTFTLSGLRKENKKRGFMCHG